MEGRSSSISRICGDIPLPGYLRLAYRMNAAFERISQYFFSFPAEVHPYQPTLDVPKLISLFGNSLLEAGPTRALCYDFIASKAQNYFSEAPSILDIGCGDGAYSRHLGAALKYRRYRGIDIAPRSIWSEFENENTSFEEGTLGEQPIGLGDVDSIFSQSVLEHVRYDGSVFDLLTSDTTKTVRHIHCLPTPYSFFEHRYHGYRRYGPFELGRLLSNDQITNLRIFSLGNGVTREFYWLQRQKKKKMMSNAQRHKKPYQYNGDLSVVENLALNRNYILPEAPQEASFYILTFDQEVKGR